MKNSFENTEKQFLEFLKEPSLKYQKLGDDYIPKDKRNTRKDENGRIPLEKQKIYIESMRKLDIIRNADVDFNSFGWINDITKKYSLSSKTVVHILKKYDREFWDNCFHCNDGKNNTGFGSCWINKNGISKRIYKEELDSFLTQGWTKGRILNKK